MPDLPFAGVASLGRIRDLHIKNQKEKHIFLFIWYELVISSSI